MVFLGFEPSVFCELLVICLSHDSTKDVRTNMKKQTFHGRWNRSVNPDRLGPQGAQAKGQASQEGFAIFCRFFMFFTYH